MLQFGVRNSGTVIWFDTESEAREAYDEIEGGDWDLVWRDTTVHDL